MAQAIASCVHCGFCLPTCPTYRALGEEIDSPRGRIFLMKSALEGGLTVQETLPFVDRCLGCWAASPPARRACSTATCSRHFGPVGAAALSARRGDRAPDLVRRRCLTRSFRVAATRAGPPAAARDDSRRCVLCWRCSRTVAAAPPLPPHYPAKGARKARVALLAGSSNKRSIPTSTGRRCGCWRQRHRGDPDRARLLRRAQDAPGGTDRGRPSPEEIRGLPAGCGCHHYQCRRLRLGHQRIRAAR